MDELKKRRLGRGLSALLGDVEPEAPVQADPASAPAGGGPLRVPIELVQPNPRNPRRYFAEPDIADLASSIRDRGIVQPILVRPVGEGGYEIIAGERRWRAAQRAQLHEVPVVVRDVSDGEALELAIIENVQRTDLNPLEEAAGYERLMQEYRYTQEDLAGVVGKSRSHVANTLRLSKLPDVVKVFVLDGRLSAGHARALLTAAEPEALAGRVLREELTVRETERLAYGAAVKKGRGKAGAAARPEAGHAAAPAAPKDNDTRALERRLGDVLGLAVTVNHRPDGSGSLTIDYRTLEQLDDVIRRIEGSY